MDDDYRFGNVEVSCEGYDYPDDPYILAGSCGVSVYIGIKHNMWAGWHTFFEMFLPFLMKGGGADNFLHILNSVLSIKSTW